LFYCANCGTKLKEDALFCPKCGIKTQKGSQENVRYPAEQMMRETFTKVGIELQKAFTLATKEMENAYQRVKENTNQKTAETSTEQKSTTCTSCGATNQSDAIYCRNCGTKLAST